MATTVKTKRGRKPRPHVTAAGDPIPGLSRRPSDGRWRVVATGYTFTEANEAAAVKRFFDLERERLGKKDRALLPFTTQQDGGDAMRLMVKAATKKPVFVGRIPLGSQQVRVQQEFDTPEMWAYFTDTVLNRPQYAVQRSGIESLGWLPELSRPKDSPKLSDIGDLYAEKPGLSPNEAGRSKLFWKEFTKAVGVDTVREITHEAIAAYEKVVQGKAYAPKSVLHRYRKIRTVFSYAIKRGRGVEDCRRALDVTAMLEVKNHTPLDPQPITKDDFWAIHKAAVKAGDETFAALMLTALNAAMYGGETSALKWEEVNLKTGELVTRRPKTGVSRVAMLWPETIAALTKLPKHGDAIFYTRVRSYTTFSVLDAWRKYRTAAGLADTVVFSMIRDASYSVACQSGSLDMAKILAGHRFSGASDHYIRRNPAFVTDACLAIHKAFFNGKKVKAS